MIRTHYVWKDLEKKMVSQCLSIDHVWSSPLSRLDGCRLKFVIQNGSENSFRCSKWTWLFEKMAMSRASVYTMAGNGVTIFERRNVSGDFDIVIGGSRGDGTVVYLACNVDKIFVLNGFKCLWKGLWKIRRKI